MAQRGNQRGQIKPAPSNRLRRLGSRRAGIDGRRGLQLALSPRPHPAIQQPNRAHRRGSHYRNSDKGVRNAAMMLQFFNRPAQAPQHIHVGSFGGQHRRERGIGRLAVQPRAADASSGKKVSDRLHAYNSL